jgi:hypothetical protein
MIGTEVAVVAIIKGLLRVGDYSIISACRKQGTYELDNVESHVFLYAKF